jgi:phospholipid/cholesterol/gamma-HCH transport system permease protein
MGLGEGPGGTAVRGAAPREGVTAGNGRARAVPGVDVVETSVRNIGSATALGMAALRSLLTQRPIWVREALIQAAFALRTVIQPVLAVNAIFALSIIGLALGIPLEQLGASDRNAAFLGVGLIREFGVTMTGAVFAGVIGTTYTAELGARTIREELDALRVMGTDPIRAMIVPRIVAVCVISPVIFLFGFLAGAIGTYVASTLYFGAPGGPFVPQLLSNTSWIDLWAAIIKVILFGFLITVIACAKGLAVKGGAQGVGRAVNESVVACLLCVFLVNIVYTQLLLGLYPDLSVFR